MTLSDALAIARSPGYPLTQAQAGALRELIMRAARRCATIADGKAFVSDHVDVLKLCNVLLDDPELRALIRAVD